MKTVIFLTISALLFNFNHRLSSDEGIVLDHAVKISEGEILYKDFFSFVAPGSFYLTGFFFKLISESYWVAKLISLILQLLSVFLIFKITLSLTKEKFLSQISAFIWLFTSSISYPAISFNTQSTYISICATFFLLKAGVTSKKSLFYYFFGGLLLGLVVIFLQNKGFLLILLFTLYLFFLVISKKLPLKSLLAFLFGSALLPASLLLLWNAKLLFQTLIIWPIKNQLVFNPHTDIIFLFGLIFLLMTTYLLFIEKDKNPLIIIGITQIGLLLSIDRRFDIYHLGINSFPLIVICLQFINRLRHDFELPSFSKRVRLFLPVLYLYLVVEVLQSNMQTFTLYQQFKAEVKKNNIDNFYAHPFLPGYYFELLEENPYPNNFLITGMHPEKNFNQNLTTLLRVKPKHVLVNYEMVEKFKYNRDNNLDNYINSNYKTVDNFGALMIMEKRFNNKHSD